MFCLFPGSGFLHSIGNEQHIVFLLYKSENTLVTQQFFFFSFFKKKLLHLPAKLLTCEGQNL